MEQKNKGPEIVKTSIEPWLSVSNGGAAIAFYKAAFNATEVYRMEDPGGGLVVKLELAGAGFWISAEAGQQSTGMVNTAPASIKFIVTVNDPDTVFAQAKKAGATEVFPVGEDYGWRLGRITDPFGFDWEIGRPL
jgi:PhnB protein